MNPRTYALSTVSQPTQITPPTELGEQWNVKDPKAVRGHVSFALTPKSQGGAAWESKVQGQILHWQRLKSGVLNHERVEIDLTSGILMWSS